jgi:hypothetical protein
MSHITVTIELGSFFAGLVAGGLIIGVLGFILH